MLRLVQSSTPTLKAGKNYQLFLRQMKVSAGPTTRKTSVLDPPFSSPRGGNFSLDLRREVSVLEAMSWWPNFKIREDIDVLDSTLIITQRRLFLKTHRAEVLLVIDFGKRFGVLRRRQFQRQKTNVLFKTLNRTSSPNRFWTV